MVEAEGDRQESGVVFPQVPIRRPSGIVYYTTLTRLARWVCIGPHTLSAALVCIDRQFMKDLNQAINWSSS